MTKHVSFAERQKIQRLQREKKLHSICEMKEPKIGAADSSGDPRPPGSFLTHTALTPAQREFLYTISASYSSARARSLITQHYRNVLLRCKPTDLNSCADDPNVTSVTSSESRPEKYPPKTQQQPESTAGAKKRSGKINSAGNSGKTSLPKSTNRPNRSGNTSANKHRKTKKGSASPAARGKSPGKVRNGQVKSEEDKESEEEKNDDGDEEDDFLNECLSLLSVADWDEEDTLSDL